MVYKAQLIDYEERNGGCGKEVAVKVLKGSMTIVSFFKDQLVWISEIFGLVK